MCFLSGLPSFHSGWCLNTWLPALDSDPLELWDPEHTEKCLESSWNLLGSPHSAADDNQRTQLTSWRSSKQFRRKLEHPRDMQITFHVWIHTFTVLKMNQVLFFLTVMVWALYISQPQYIHGWTRERCIVHYLVDCNCTIYFKIFPFRSGL